jgi:hypothetical protein
MIAFWFGRKQMGGYPVRALALGGEQLGRPAAEHVWL